jgi:hypothetical protein
LEPWTFEILDEVGRMLNVRRRPDQSFAEYHEWLRKKWRLIQRVMME